MKLPEGVTRLPIVRKPPVLTPPVVNKPVELTVESASVPIVVELPKWVVISDWHIFEQFGRGGNQRARDAYREIGDHNPTLGISCGDLICQHGDSPMIDYELLRQMESRSRCPWLHAIGNHESFLPAKRNEEDIINSTKAFYKGIQDEYTFNEHEFAQIPTEDYLAPPFMPIGYPQLVYANPLLEKDRPDTLGYYAMYHQPTGVVHIVLNSSALKEDVTWDAYYSQAQMKWLEQEVLGKLNETHRIVIYQHHQPRLAGIMTIAARDWLHSTLLGFKGKVLAVFTGHHHTNQYYPTGGINYIGLPSGGNASVSYTNAGSAPKAYAICRWHEDESTFFIQGYNGCTTRKLKI